MELRPYQTKAVAEVYSAIQSGFKRVIVASATGSGKTVIMAKIASDALKAGKRILVIVDDSPLIPQTADKFSIFGITSGFIKSGLPENRYLSCQIASIDTLIKRELPPADVIFIDECHQSFAKKYGVIWENYNEKIFIGFSATPERTNKKESLSRDWQHLIKAVTIKQAVEIGANVPPTVYSIRRGRLGLNKIRTSRGDYVQAQLGLAMRDPAIVNLAVEEWLKKAQGRPTFTFCVDVEHSKDVCRAYNAAGVSAEQLDGSTDERERERKLDRLVEGKINILTSVNVLSMGVDRPSVSCIQSCRPSKSRIIWIQQVGRGLRPAEGKDDCIVIDQGENTFNLGHPLEYEPGDLINPDNGKGITPVKECPECECINLNFALTCVKCGYLFPIKEKLKTHGEMEEVAPRILSPELLNQQKFYRSKCRIAIDRGYSPDWAVMQFKNRYGFRPNTIVRRNAFFPAGYSDESLLLYAEYLEDVAKRKDKDWSWIQTHLTHEFGKLDL